MEVVKNVAAIIGVILSSTTLLGLCSKTVRTWLTSIFAKYGNGKELNDTKDSIEKLAKETRESIQILSDKTNDSIRTLAEDTNKSLEHLAKMIEKQSDSLEVSNTFTKLQCKNMLKTMFYVHKDERTLPLYEKKTLMSVEDIYINKLHGNSFGKVLIDEMNKWEVDISDVDENDFVE